MSELAAPEHEEIVGRLYLEAVEALGRGEPIRSELRVVHDVEHLMQEANSGASFEQYFRWASLDEITNIRGHLRQLGLDDVAQLVARALEVAFPNGVPASDEAKSDATEWTPEQEEALAELFPALEEHNGRVMNALGRYASGFARSSR